MFYCNAFVGFFQKVDHLSVIIEAIQLEDQPSFLISCLMCSLYPVSILRGLLFLSFFFFFFRGYTQRCSQSHGCTRTDDLPCQKPPTGVYSSILFHGNFSLDILSTKSSHCLCTDFFDFCHVMHTEISACKVPP